MISLERAASFMTPQSVHDDVCNVCCSSTALDMQAKSYIGSLTKGYVTLAFWKTNLLTGTGYTAFVP